jgi:CDP-glucose 4,6-dehydratase
MPNAAHWRGRRALVTGHTGFVGGWLCAWLAKMGARVCGYALEPPTTPSFHALTRLDSVLERSMRGDVTDAAALSRAIAEMQPQVLFHLAAQPMVRDAFRDPAATFATNVMGTVNLLEASRRCGALENVVVYTTDKVYRNDESGRAFTEEERLGGNEPYSASKAAAELAVDAYWESYLGKSPRPPVASVVRAGNIIGGGDWGHERLLPDAVRAFSEGRELVIRNPASTRPWQHVLDVVRGTLVLAESSEPSTASLAWNLGPPAGDAHPVSRVADAAVRAWGGSAAWRHEPDGSIPEARALVLSSAKAHRELGWRTAWDLDRAMAATMEWYSAARDGGHDMLALSGRQIDAHLAEVAGLA